MKNKIYDCFTFYNELDLLDIRLSELYNHVDHFVLVEATTTFTNRSKPLYFDKNKNRYKKYIDKIIYIKVDDMPLSTNAWDNERFQRNAITRGLTNADAEDIIIISDCDEIIRARSIDTIKDSKQSVFAFRMPLYNFKFNYMRVTPGEYDVWAMAAKRNILANLTPDSLRSMRFHFNNYPLGIVQNGVQMIEHAGWHFGYMGNTEYLLDKARSFSHQEVNTPEFLARIDPVASIAARTSWDHKGIDKYEIVAVDDYLPQAVTDYPDMLLPGAEAKAIDLLPRYPYN